MSNEEPGMAFVSVTRLRVRAWRFMPGFALEAIRSLRQVRAAAGFLDGALLPDRHRTYWTMTVWDGAESMRGYMTAGAHRVAMPKLMEWCDEASVVHWEQADAAVPSWAEADRRMRSEGRASKVRRPSKTHAGLQYQTPRTTASTKI